MATLSSAPPTKASSVKPITLLLIVVFLLLNCFMAFWFASPYFAVNDIKAAAANSDQSKLSRLLDLPAIKESIKGQLVDDQIIDMAVSPAGLTNLFNCSNLVTGSIGLAGSQANVDGAARLQTVGVTPEVEPNSVSANDYVTLDQFVSYTGQKYSGQGVKFILKRSGLFGWKLTGMEFQSSPVVHTPVYVVGYLTEEVPAGIKDLQLYDRLLAVNDEPVVDYPGAVLQFKAAGNSANIAVLRDGEIKSFGVSKPSRGKFGVILSGMVFSPKPGVVATPAALDKKYLLELMQSQDPAATAALMQQGQMVLLQPGSLVLSGPAIELPVGNNNGVQVFLGHLLEGRATTGPQGLPGRNFWMLLSNFPEKPPEQ
ncbi:MAG: hypothetical protein QG574_52 [Cyanobacteriota bacterium erpe_2018_sw_21hr_WHONDRS-SW48-000092_B_bin.40]|nr:hypothetical protein [Cyanobacteriota bacterium erpe_2018_sw_21hr_WHONDRS-SW48-000092_B_bin.40]